MLNKNCFVRYKAIIGKPKLRLFCFHHSGGAASFFADWIKFLPVGVELLAIQLSGREGRGCDGFANDMNIVVKEVVNGFYEFQEVPFIFFGHSMGSIVAFECTNELRKNQMLMPYYLVVSGRNAPQFSYGEELLHLLPDELFLKNLLKYDGIPDEVLKNEELLQLLLPRLRADFILIENYQYRESLPLECPIYVLGGSDDYTVTQDGLVAWQNHTTKNCKLTLFPGGHFFINNNKKDVIKLIASLY